MSQCGVASFTLRKMAISPSKYLVHTSSFTKTTMNIQHIQTVFQSSSLHIQILVNNTVSISSRAISVQFPSLRLLYSGAETTHSPTILTANRFRFLLRPLPQLYIIMDSIPRKAQQDKRRRQQRKACDICRRRKVRCDIVDRTSGPCSVCEKSGLECR